MEYKDHEIFARVCGTYSDLYTLTDDGELDESQDMIIYNDDEQIVWFEVEAVDPHSGTTTIYAELETIEDAKEIVDKSTKYLKKTHPEDYEESK